MREINGPKRGVFWVIQEKLFAFPFEEGKYPEALAKSKKTYTHKKLWRIVCPKGCEKAVFGIVGDIKIHYEHTAHYRCHLDTEWRPES